jgi:hypothetical protein
MATEALTLDSSTAAPAGAGKHLNETLSIRSRMTSSRLIGALFPLGFLVYGTGFALVMSVVGTPDFLSNMADHQTTLTLGAFLMLLNTAVDIGKAVLFFPILENHGKRTAVLYLAAMTLEVALMAVGIVSLLMLVPLGHVVDAGVASAAWAGVLGSILIHSNEMAYQIAMMTLAVANIFLWSLTFRLRLIPRLLSVWGATGYVILTAGSIAEVFGLPFGVMASIPGGLFEITLGVWLIVKGFEPKAYARTSA